MPEFSVLTAGWDSQMMGLLSRYQGEISLLILRGSRSEKLLRYRKVRQRLHAVPTVVIVHHADETERAKRAGANDVWMLAAYKRACHRKGPPVGADANRPDGQKKTRNDNKKCPVQLLNRPRLCRQHKRAPGAGIFGFSRSGAARAAALLFCFGCARGCKNGCNGQSSHRLQRRSPVCGGRYTPF